MTRPAERDGFLERMLAPLSGRADRRANRWLGDPIRNHLVLLLNARQGSNPLLPDYGLPDVTSFYSEYPVSLSELRTKIEQLIRKYEPRLANVRVRLIESDESEFRVALLITGEIPDEDAAVKVQYKTTIASNGRASLEEVDAA